jgi:hypothetical protein
VSNAFSQILDGYTDSLIAFGDSLFFSSWESSICHLCSYDPGAASINTHADFASGIGMFTACGWKLFFVLSDSGEELWTYSILNQSLEKVYQIFNIQVVNSWNNDLVFTELVNGTNLLMYDTGQ